MGETEQSGSSSTSSAPRNSADRVSFNNTADFNFSGWARQDLASTDARLVAYGRSPAAVGVGTRPIIMAIADFKDANFKATPAGQKPGHVLAAYAIQAGKTSYAILQVMPDTGGLTATGWIVFGVYSDERWTIEDSPSRWQARDVEGMAAFDGMPWVLLKGPQGRELWHLDSGTWISETVPVLDTFWGIASVAANRTTLFVAGVDTLGQPVVLQRPGVTGAFRSDVLQQPVGTPATHHVRLAVPAEGTPLVVWSVSWAVRTNPNYELFDVFTARHVNGTWEVLPGKLPQQMEFQPSYDGQNAYIASTLMSGAEALYWLNSEAAWQECPTEEVTQATLIPGDAVTWLGDDVAGPAGQIKRLGAQDCNSKQ